MSTARAYSSPPKYPIPCRFALCEYDEDANLHLYLWGIQTATEAFGFFPDSNGTWHSSSAEAIESTLPMIKCTDLIWLDTPPTNDD